MWAGESSKNGESNYHPKLTNWADKFDWSGKERHEKKLVIDELNGQGAFEVTLVSPDKAVMDSLTASNFEIEILTAKCDHDSTMERSNVYIDGKPVNLNHNDGHSLDESLQSTAPPPLLVRIHYLGEQEPVRFAVRPHKFPETRVYALVNAGHYKSMTLRRSGGGSSYATFYHHHGDWNEHVLYAGWFSTCTYAYDCYPNHSIPSHTTSKGDESWEWCADCYSCRCP
jgi:hypothetical protein